MHIEAARLSLERVVGWIRHTNQSVVGPMTRGRGFYLPPTPQSGLYKVFPVNALSDCMNFAATCSMPVFRHTPMQLLLGIFCTLNGLLSQIVYLTDSKMLARITFLASWFVSVN
jgi:hypothetical protein